MPTVTRQALRTLIASGAVLFGLVILPAYGGSSGDTEVAANEETTTTEGQTSSTVDPKEEMGTDSPLGDKATSTTTTLNPTTPSPTPTAGTPAQPGPGSAEATTPGLSNLPNGQHYGYFSGYTTGQIEGQEVTIMKFDKVEFLTGPEAEQAAIDHGEDPEVDFYIVNDNPLVRQLAVTPEASVTTLIGGSSDPQPSSSTEVANQSYLFRISTDTVRGITTIQYIEAIYLP